MSDRAEAFIDRVVLPTLNECLGGRFGTSAAVEGDLKRGREKERCSIASRDASAVVQLIFSHDCATVKMVIEKHPSPDRQESQRHARFNSGYESPFFSTAEHSDDAAREWLKKEIEKLFPVAE